MKSAIEISKLDPDRIYLENVRAILGTNSFLARIYCEMAVVDGSFTKHVGLVCSNSSCNRIIASYPFLSKIPDEIECDICADSDQKVSTFKTKNLAKIIFYKLAR